MRQRIADIEAGRIASMGFEKRFDRLLAPSEQSEQDTRILDDFDIVGSGYPDLLENLESSFMVSAAKVIEGQQLPGVDRGLPLRLLPFNDFTLTPDRFCEVTTAMGLLALLLERENWR